MQLGRFRTNRMTQGHCAVSMSRCEVRGVRDHTRKNTRTDANINALFYMRWSTSPPGCFPFDLCFIFQLLEMGVASIRTGHLRSAFLVEEREEAPNIPSSRVRTRMLVPGATVIRVTTSSAYAAPLCESNASCFKLQNGFQVSNRTEQSRPAT